MPSLADVAAAASEAGLALRGAFEPRPADGVAPLAHGVAPATVILLGNVGSSLWPAFSASAEYADGAPHPLDRWTRRVVDGLADRLGAGALYPFGGPPHWPFQRWAQRAEDVHPSPLGLLIHPEFGLWHAYRAALLFAEAIEPRARPDRPSPCAACRERPCLAACPVGAFTGASYEVAACAAHIGVAAGADCMGAGCLARRACPVGAEHAYCADHARFHMDAFRRARMA